jgi:hypothetical protein
MLMVKSVAFSPLLLDTSCELHLPVVSRNISSCPIFAFRSPTIIFFSSWCMSSYDLSIMGLPAVTDSGVSHLMLVNLVDQMHYCNRNTVFV